MTSGQSSTWRETAWAWNEGYGAAGRAVDACRGGRLWRQAQHPAAARRARRQGDGGAGQHRRRGDPGDASRTASSCPTARATRPRPATMRCRSSGTCWRPTCRSSASASATRCWRWRSARTTVKMHQGHHGANHPVKDHTTGKVEIVSMNHGFAVDCEIAAGGRRGNPRFAVRRLELRHCAHRPAGVLGAAPSRGVARPAGFALSVPPLRQPDPRAPGRAAARRAPFRPHSSVRSGAGNRPRSQGRPACLRSGC